MYKASFICGKYSVLNSALLYQQNNFFIPKMIKVAILLALCACVSAGAIGYAVQTESYDPHPQYNYGYSVSDALTGDQKSAHETRDGDVVSGQYSLVEPDGAVRTVTYTADPIHGFNAVVERSAGAITKAVVATSPIRAGYY